MRTATTTGTAASTAAAALALLLGATGCGVPTDAGPRPLDSVASPFALPGSAGQTAADPTAVPSGRAQVDLYFAQDGLAVLTLRPVDSTMPLAVPALLDLLLAGPTESELQAGTSSVIPSSLTIEAVALEGTTAVITLGGPAEQIQSTQALAFAQIVATLTAAGGVSGVRFRLGDADLPVPRGDGALSERPLNRTDYTELIAGASASASASVAPATAAPA